MQVWGSNLGPGVYNAACNASGIELVIWYTSNLGCTHCFLCGPAVKRALRPLSDDRAHHSIVVLVPPFKMWRPAVLPLHSPLAHPTPPPLRQPPKTTPLTVSTTTPPPPPWTRVSDGRKPSKSWPATTRSFVRNTERLRGGSQVFR